MRKVLKLIGAIGILLNFVSCDKEPSQGIDSSSDYCARFSFTASIPIETKVDATFDDSAIDRIDIYVFDHNGTAVKWNTIRNDDGSDLDLPSLSWTDRGPGGYKRTYLFMANLDKDTAEYLSLLDTGNMSRNPEGVIPFSANFRLDHLIMGGTAAVDFNSSTKDISVSLYRYMSKIEIGTITADFPETSDFDRDIYVKHIVIANAWDFFRVLQTNVKNLSGDPSDMFGYKVSGGNIGFGNLTSGYSNPNTMDNITHADYDGTFSLASFGGKGKLAKTYDYMYNKNRQLEAYEIGLSCPESVEEASQYTFNVDAGKGQLCSTYLTIDPILDVNKVFYTMPTFFNVTVNEPCSWTGQDRQQRLILAVKFNGKLYFYPIRLKRLQPNMTYHIKNISLRGEPSVYANFYEWKQSKHDPSATGPPRVATKATMTEHINEYCMEEWTVDGNVATIENLELYGYSEGGGYE